MSFQIIVNPAFAENFSFVFHVEPRNLPRSPYLWPGWSGPLSFALFCSKWIFIWESKSIIKYQYNCYFHQIPIFFWKEITNIKLRIRENMWWARTLLSPPDTASMLPDTDQLTCQTTSSNVCKVLGVQLEPIDWKKKKKISSINFKQSFI